MIGQALVTAAVSTTYVHVPAGTPPTNDAQYPGDRCCALYADSYYSGSSLTACLESYASEGYVDVKDNGFNDEMTSWWCGKDIAYNFCNDNPGDDCNNGHGSLGAGSQQDSNVGDLNDKLTTLYLYEYD